MTKPLRTYKTTFTGACLLEVEAGTNGPQGGDSGHGGRIMLRLKDLGGTDIEAKWDETNRELTIKLGGDAEQYVFMEALRFALEVYEIQMQIAELEQKLYRLTLGPNRYRAKDVAEELGL